MESAVDVHSLQRINLFYYNLGPWQDEPKCCHKMSEWIHSSLGKNLLISMAMHHISSSTIHWTSLIFLSPAFSFVKAKNSQIYQCCKNSNIHSLLGLALAPYCKQRSQITCWHSSNAVANRLKSDDDYRDPVLKTAYKDSTGMYKLQ